MKKFDVKLFRNVRFVGDWEVDFQAGPLQLRIGRSQVALWYTHKCIPQTLFCWVSNYRPQGYYTKY